MWRKWVETRNFELYFFEKIFFLFFFLIPNVLKPFGLFRWYNGLDAPSIFLFSIEVQRRAKQCRSDEVPLYEPPHLYLPGRVAQSVGHLTRKSGVLGSIPGLATYFRFSFRFFMKGSCQLLAKVCARSTG